MIWSRVLLGRWRMVHHMLLDSGRERPSRARRPLLGGVLALMLGAIVCAGLAGLFGQIASEGATAREASRVLALILTAALFGMLVFDLHEVVSTLIADSDLELLRRAPVPPSALFVLKLIDAFPRTSLLVLVLAVPATLAYHVFYPLPAWAWLVFPLQLVGLWAIPLGLGTAAAILLLRHVPPRRAREALGLLSTVTLFVLWLANAFLLPRLAGSSSGDPLQSLRNALEGSSLLDRLSPGRWAAEAIGAAASSATADALGATAMLLIAAALTLTFSAWIAARHLEAAQSVVAAGSGAGRGVGARAGARARESATRRAATGRGSRSPHFVATVLRRDARLFLRDWAVLGDVLTTAILWTLLPLLGTPLYQASSHQIARAMMLALTVGLGYEIGARMLPFERRGIAWVRLGPVSASRWIVAKLAGAAMLSAPLMALAAASMTIALGLGPRQTLEALAIAVPALALALSVGLWTGTVFGRSGWTNPRAMLTVTGRAAATLLLLLQAIAWLALAALADSRRASLPPGTVLWAPAVIAALLAVFPLRAAAVTLAHREWNE